LSAVSGLRHPALSALDAAPPREARLTDRRRVAALLQGVALLGHLERTGWALVAGWEGVRVTPDGRLGNVKADRGVDSELPQRRAEELLLLLFRADESIAGRGVARRASRGLLRDWRQDLEPVRPDALVGQVLDAAPFLWEAAYGDARATLAAEVGGELWVAGPCRFRRRLLRGCAGLRALRASLATGDAARHWGGRRRTASEPVALARAGRWRRAAAAWAASPPTSAASRYEMARALFALGRFDAAARALAGLRRAPARALRLECRLRLGELRAVKRALVGWDIDRGGENHVVAVAAIAARLYARLGDPESARPWIERALASGSRRARLEAAIVAGEAAWDRGDQAEVDRQLARSKAARDSRQLAWKWSHLRALAAISRGDGAAVVSNMGRALGSRRRVRPFEAAGLWNDLAVGRLMTGDLAGAERALRHVVRLTEGAEGDRRTTLALCNLAEIRLRRGRLRGVRDAIERSARANARAGNRLGLIQDQELRVRFELARGRPGTAIALVKETLQELAETRLAARRGRLLVLAGRAHGWLGEASLARQALTETTAEERAELEPEERPALWALAGELEKARTENPEGPCRELWLQVLAGDRVAGWQALDALEPYRAARFVFDVECVAPDTVPGARLRQAAARLRAVDATAFADRLSVGATPSWRALEHYLDTSSEALAVDRLAAFLAEINPEARLSWRDEDCEVELVRGVGGGRRLEVPLHGGALRLEAPDLGARERAVLGLARRDLPPLGMGRGAPPRPRRGIVGRSAVLAKAIDRLSKLARRDISILITGETGTGKELAARLVHEESSRAGRVFLPVNCSALAESLLLSELFGHVRGAFTGADRDRAGIFETAHGGTVLLDEIGDLPPGAQSKLLRVLQEGEVRRVGDSRVRPVDVRVVAATHRDLTAMVDAGDFRQDLFFRLGVGRVALPSLRERASDIHELTEHFLAAECPSSPPRVTDAARTALEAHSWPGNVRELRNVIQVAVALSDGGLLELAHLDLPRRAMEPRSGYHERVERFRRALVTEALESARGNRAEAARRLDLSRQALSYLVRRLDID
jgi:transcriptional regulator with AAA-type ATPase domain